MLAAAPKEDQRCGGSGLDDHRHVTLSMPAGASGRDGE